MMAASNANGRENDAWPASGVEGDCQVACIGSWLAGESSADVAAEGFHETGQCEEAEEEQWLEVVYEVEAESDESEVQRDERGVREPVDDLACLVIGRLQVGGQDAHDESPEHGGDADERGRARQDEKDDELVTDGAAPTHDVAAHLGQQPDASGAAGEEC